MEPSLSLSLASFSLLFYLLEVWRQFSPAQDCEQMGCKPAEGLGRITQTVKKQTQKGYKHTREHQFSGNFNVNCKGCKGYFME